MDTKNTYADSSVLLDDPVLTEQQSQLAATIFDFVLDVGQTIDGYWTLSVMAPNEPPKTAFINARDQQHLLEASARAAIRNTQGYGVHLGMAGRREAMKTGRGSMQDLTNLCALWCDVDEGDLDTIQARCDEMKLPPHLICHTGRGYHLYWLLKVPAPADEKTGRTLRQLAVELGGDVQASPLTTMMRVPGTIKYKPDVIVPTQIVYRDYGGMYMPDEFAWLDPGPVPKRAVRPFVRVEGDPDRPRITAADIAARCDGVQRGKEWYCRCPVPTHGSGKGDRSRSLEVKDGNSGVVVHCFANCTVEQITESLGLKVGDLFASEGRPATRAEMRAQAMSLFGVDADSSR